ncbi:MAG: hypothetical protein Q4A29_08150 [Eubacteriales bacterium]|nr:hypothetical protein [Eubacteriales bacterium]
MKELIAIKVDKIQKFIYQRMDDRRADWQHDSKSLQTIVRASNHVANDILNDIEVKFQGKIESKYLWISGKAIFSVKDVENEDIDEKLKSLFEEIYKKYKGVIRLVYTHFNCEIENELKIILEANKHLKLSEQENRVFLAHSDLLFKFTELEDKEKPDEQVNGNHKCQEDWGAFAQNLNALEGIGDKVERAEEPTSRKIAVVKADINNMQQTFQAIDDYKKYQSVSKALRDHISLECLSKTIEEYKYSDLKGKILPFYAVGDDIFFVTRVDSVLHSIKMLGNLVNKINTAIHDELQEGKADEKQEDIPTLTISVGVTFTDNHMPIRYYREMVEEELSNAKKYTKELKANQICLGTSICGNYFSLYREGLGYGEEDGLNRFIQEIEELKWFRNKEIFSNTALNQLLRTIERKDEKTQMRLLLYFLMPDISTTKSSIYELFFKYYFLSQLVEDKNLEIENDREERKFEVKKIAAKLIPKMKLILLLVDKRFVDTTNDENFHFEYIIRCDKEKYKDLVKRIFSVLFTKPLNYLLLEMEENGNNIESLFVEQRKETIFVEGKKKEITVYAKERIHSSVLHRMKRLLSEDKKELLKKVVRNYIMMNKAVEQQLADEQQENEVKVNYRKELELGHFEEKIDALENNNTTWLDNLILFYQYDEQRMRRNKCKEVVEKFIQNSTESALK